MRSIIVKIILAGLLSLGIAFVCMPAYKQMRVHLLDEHIPMDLSYLLTLHNEKEVDQATLRNYRRYYKLVDLIYPNQHAVKALLGYCDFYANNLDLSIQHYRFAAEKEPGNFWYNYNLAIVLLNKGKRQEALEFLDKALTSDQETTLKILVASKPNVDLLRLRPNFQDASLERVKEAYANAYRLKVLLQLGETIPAKPILFI